MRRRAFALTVVALSLALSAAAQQPPTPPPPGPAAPSAPSAADRNLASLAWLAGTWRGEAEGGGAFETTYSSPEGGLILSLTKSLAGDKVDFYEFERIEVLDGVVTLSPYPMGEAATTFQLSDYDPAVKKAVFKAPHNDYPTELVFELTGPDALVITIAGDREGHRVTMRLDLKRKA